MAKEGMKTVTVKSVLDSTLIHSGIEIMSGEIVELDAETAKVLIAKGFCEEVKRRKVGE